MEKIINLELLPDMPDALKSCNVACNRNYYHDPAQGIEHEYLVRVCKIYQRCCHDKQKPVCPSHYTSIISSKMQSLSLSSKVTGDKDTHYSNDPYLPLHMTCKEDAANNYDICIAVYYMINKISFWTGCFEISCHKTINSIKYRVEENHKSAGQY